MEAKTGAKVDGDETNGTDAVGEGTMISYALFALVGETGQPQAEAEQASAAQISPAQTSPEQTSPAQPADAATAPPGAGAAESGAEADPLQSALDKYSRWLRSING